MRLPVKREKWQASGRRRGSRGESANGDLSAIRLRLPEVVLHLLEQPAFRAAPESRIPISGEIPRRPLRSMESVLRDTATPFAASVTVNPGGWRHCRRTTPPGWAGRA